MKYTTARLALWAATATLTTALPLLTTRDDTNTSLPIKIVSTQVLSAGNWECKVWHVKQNAAAGTFTPVCKQWADDTDASTADDQSLELRTVKLADATKTCGVWHVEAHEGYVEPVCGKIEELRPVTASTPTSVRSTSVASSDAGGETELADIRAATPVPVRPTPVAAKFDAGEETKVDDVHSIYRGPPGPTLNPQPKLPVVPPPHVSCQTTPCAPKCRVAMPDVQCDVPFEPALPIEAREPDRDAVINLPAPVGPVKLPSVGQVDEVVVGIKLDAKDSAHAATESVEDEFEALEREALEKDSLTLIEK